MVLVHLVQFNMFKTPRTGEFGTHKVLQQGLSALDCMEPPKALWSRGYIESFRNRKLSIREYTASHFEKQFPILKSHV